MMMEGRNQCKLCHHFQKKTSFILNWSRWFCRTRVTFFGGNQIKQSEIVKDLCKMYVQWPELRFLYGHYTISSSMYSPLLLLLLYIAAICTFLWLLIDIIGLSGQYIVHMPYIPPFLSIYPLWFDQNMKSHEWWCYTLYWRREPTRRQ